MRNIVQVVLIFAMCGGALALGGVLPLAVSLIETGLFLSGLLVLWAESQHRELRFPIPVWTALFVLLIIFQLIPFPSALVRILSPWRLPQLGAVTVLGRVSAWTTISIDPHRTIESLLRMLAYLCAFALAAYLFDSKKKRSALIQSLIVLGCLEAGYGIIQYLGDWHRIYGFMKVYDSYNATGTYINRNDFAGLLELILPFVLASAFYAFQKQAQNPNMVAARRAPAGRGSFNAQVFFYLTLVACISVALIFSASRGGILAATFSLLFIALLAQIKIKHKGWMVLVVLFFTLVIGYGVWIGMKPVLSRFEQMRASNFMTLESRPAIWKDSLRLIRQYPLTGTGLGTFDIAFRRYQTELLELFVDHAHNDYLEYAAETGLPGAALLFIPILWLLGRMIVSFLNDRHRYRRSVLLGSIGATLALLIHSLTDFNLHIPANAVIFAVVLGIGYKAACLERRTDSRTQVRVSHRLDTNQQ